MSMDDRGHKDLSEFCSEEDEEESEDSVIVEEDDSDVEGDIFL